MQHNLSSSVEDSSEDRTKSTVQTIKLVEDHVFRKEMNRFIKSTNGMNLSKLIHILQNDILYDKPENIMDYICDIFFSPVNQLRLKSLIS